MATGDDPHDVVAVEAPLLEFPSLVTFFADATLDRSRRLRIFDTSSTPDRVGRAKDKEMTSTRFVELLDVADTEAMEAGVRNATICCIVGLHFKNSLFF